VTQDESHVSVGGLLEAYQRGKQGDFWKENMHEESDNWKKEQHAHMHGRPNDDRVRVFVMYCNKMQENFSTSTNVPARQHANTQWRNGEALNLPFFFFNLK
jgi:hypothetical protein